MLLPPKVIPFLMHDNVAVRTLALHYLSDAHDPSPATADDLWKAIDRHGPGKFDRFCGALSTLPQTESSLDRTLKALAGEQDENRRALLERTLARLHYGLLLRYRDLIEDSPHVSDDLRNHVQKRIVLATVPPMELWERLMEIGLRDDRPDQEEVGRIIEALARSPEFAGWAINTLNDPAIDDWREVFCVELLGRMRHRPAAGLIIEKFKVAEADDMIASQAVDALSRIGSVEVVQQLKQQYGSMQVFTRAMAADILGRIKLNQSEAALIALLPGESDSVARTSLAAGLCALATTDAAALDRLGTMVASGDWDRELLDLDQDVAGLFGMVGRTIPKPAARPTNLFASASPSRELSWDDQDDDELVLPPRYTAPAEQESAPPPAAAPKPIRRDVPKVGRNDPCPCGSGKKYKKCCGA
jgi:hypothetical protein